MTEPLEPTTATYIKLVYVLRQAVADGSDPDNYPDWLPMPEGTTGVIQFPVRKILAPQANPPVTFYPKDIPVTFDDTTGEMLDAEGNPGVWVVSPLNPKHQPHGFTLTLVLTIPNSGTEKFSIGIVNPSGADTYDITLNSPVPDSSGTSITVGPPGPSAYEVAVANGFTGTPAEWLASITAFGVLPVDGHPGIAEMTGIGILPQVAPGIYELDFGG